MGKFREEKGASAVEFAIVASLLFLILFGIIQFGIAYNRVQGLNSAGREGARAASIGSNIGEVVSRVRTAQSLFQQTDVLVDIDYSIDNGSNFSNVCTSCTNPNTGKVCTGGCTVGSLIRVTGRVLPSTKYAIAIPLWASVKPTWTGTGSFRVEKT